MNINVTCEKHNVSMKVIREWTSRGDIEVTVEPCPDCIEEAAQQSVQADCCPVCNGSGLDITLGQFGTCNTCGGTGNSR